MPVTMSPTKGQRREHGQKPTDIEVVLDLIVASSLLSPWLVAGRVGDAGTSLPRLLDAHAIDIDQSTLRWLR